MKTIFLTGGSGKIGRQYLTHFLEKGDKVLATTRSKERLKKVLINESGIEESGLSNLSILEVDLEQKGAIKHIISKIKERNFSPDILIHNARSLEYVSINENQVISRSDFVNEFKLDVVIPYELSTQMHRSFQTLKNIIFISSIYGVVAPNKNLYKDFHNSSPINYGVCKSAQIHLTKELAVRLGEENIRVNAISYGGVGGRVNNDFQDRYSNLTPMGGMLEERDVIGAIDFLTSNNSKNITGHNLLVDGGWTIW